MARPVINLAEHARYAGLDNRLRHFAEIVAAIDDDLFIQLLPVGHPMFSHGAPYALIHHPPMREQRVVRVMSYGQVGETLIADLLQDEGFTRKPLEDWEAYEKARQISEMKQRQEEIAERKDRLTTVFQTLEKNHFAKYADGSYIDPLLRSAHQGR